MLEKNYGILLSQVARHIGIPTSAAYKIPHYLSISYSQRHHYDVRFYNMLIKNSGELYV
jgi:hypothetical protein